MSRGPFPRDALAITVATATAALAAGGGSAAAAKTHAPPPSSAKSDDVARGGFGTAAELFVREVILPGGVVIGLALLASGAGG